MSTGELIILYSHTVLWELCLLATVVFELFRMYLVSQLWQRQSLESCSRVQSMSSSNCPCINEYFHKKIKAVPEYNYIY